MKIKFNINNDSILKVTAYDLENENNSKELEIKKPKGLSDIIYNIKKEDDQIKIIDIEEYNQIKDTILELEEKIYNSSDNYVKDSFKRIIIEIFGKFIIDILSKIHKEPLILSYIKYYFKKVSKDYNYIFTENNNSFEKVVVKILKEIHFYKQELICELIEPFVDFQNIYSRCLFQLINSYYEKIRQDFNNVGKLKQETDEDRNIVLMNLSYLKDMISISLKFYERLDIEGKKFMKHIKDLIQNYELRIEVKEYLINYEKKKINYNEKDELRKLEKLVEKYYECESFEIEDRIKLIEIYTTIKPQNDYKIDKKEKEELFLDIFEKMPQDSSKKFFYFFDEYNPDEEKYNDIDANIFINQKERRKQEEFLTKVYIDLQKLSKEEKNENKREVYLRILNYLNYLRDKGPSMALFDDIE